ncbi:MAG: hypothetical protein KQH53_15440 [Desulfarculaceae bacterium]|nr:hypothetical protein [Desulfarculaceae bacterium]
MSTKITSEWGIEVAPSVVKRELDKAKEELNSIPKVLQQEFERITKITQREFSAFVQGTAKDASDTWDKTTKEMNSITGKSLWGSVKAVFQDDMDQVEDIWEDAWQGMLGKADTLWDGLLVIVRRRLQRSLRTSQGPEVFPGALAFGEMLFSASVP